MAMIQILQGRLLLYIGFSKAKSGSRAIHNRTMTKAT